MTTRHRWRLRAAWAAVTASIVLASFVIYWLLRPYSAVTFSQFRTDRQAYAPGDVVTMRDVFCWDGTPFDAERWFVSEVSSISNGTVSFPRGYAIERVAARYVSGCSTTTIRVDLPESMPPGQWAIEYRVSYRANPIRVVTVTNTSNTFTVN